MILDRLEFEQRVRLLRRAYDAFNRRDIDAVLSMLDPDVEWPNMLDLSILPGREAVHAYWEGQFHEIDPHVEPAGFIADGERVIADVHQVVRDRHGSLLGDQRVAHRYTFRGPFILRMQVQPPIDLKSSGASPSVAGTWVSRQPRRGGCRRRARS